MRVTDLIPPLAVFVAVTGGFFLADQHVFVEHHTRVVTKSVSSPPAPLVPPGLPPLIAAAAAGQPEEVRRLLDQGADVNARCAVPNNRTAMQAALYHRQNDIDRLEAVPPDTAGLATRNEPLDDDGRVKDEDYREVVGMLREAAREARMRNPREKARKQPAREVYFLAVCVSCAGYNPPYGLTSRRRRTGGRPAGAA